MARLEKQARFCAGWLFPDFDIPDGARVLDLATGVGAMAGLLRTRWPTARLTGVDLSPAQLAWARKNHRDVPISRADAARLPFAANTFDRVHCTWLLEHVPQPVPILRDVLRVLKPGGYAIFTEVDNATFETDPPSEAVTRAMNGLNEAQVRAHGDPFVGRRLEQLFRDAGFPKIERVPKLLHGHNGAPELFATFVDEFAEIFEGLDEALPHEKATHAAAAAHLRSLPQRNGQMRYRPVVVKGFK
ncbi:MAG: class I SAM-dependent methyltransferase [Myxococcaceae bacterium]